ncbi:MAG: hypothetical protein V1735_00910 [Nanoarchaeota archaeon]
MNFLDTFLFIVKIQAVFLMLVVFLKLWALDRSTQKSKIALTYERFTKYSLFKQALLFIMLTVLFGTVADILRARFGQGAATTIFQLLSAAGLILFSYLLFRISSTTAAKPARSGFLQAIASAEDVIVPLVGGAVTSVLLFFAPLGSPTGMAVSQSFGSSVFDVLFLLMLLGTLAMVLWKNMHKVKK